MGWVKLSSLCTKYSITRCVLLYIVTWLHAIILHYKFNDNVIVSLIKVM